MTRLEICPVCNETFNNTRAGDKHRVIDYTYTLAEKNGKVYRFHTGELIPKGYVVKSTNNEHRRCLTHDEMIQKGMSQEKNGSWNCGGNWINSPWNK